MSFGRIRIFFLCLALVCYVTCLALPALRNGGEPWPGWVLLLIGWQAFFVAEFRWLANWFFFVAVVVILVSREKVIPIAPIVLSLIGLSASASCLFIPIRSAQGSGGSGFSHGFATLEIGAYFWVASFALLFIASLAPNSFRPQMVPNTSFQGTARKRAAPEVERYAL